MKKTSAASLAAVALGLVASATSCSTTTAPVKVTRSSASAVTLTSPGAATVAMNLQLVRAVAVQGVAGKQFMHFTRQQSSDARLVAALKEACMDLQGRTPAAAVGELKRAGWTGPEAVMLLQTASDPDMFCPGEYRVVAAWLKAGAGG